MERIDKTVFISYRRTNFPWALAIFKDLTSHGYDVFIDYDGISSGDFERVILENIKARAHFLVLLTPSALERCADPADWLRREIETALDNKRNTIPLMLEGFDFGTPTIASQLTGTLAALKDYNGVEIPRTYFDAAMERLRKYLNVPLTAVLHPASVSARRAATKQKAAANAAPAVQQEELTAQQWFERGFAAIDLDEQLRYYTKAIRLKPDYSDAFYNRGLTHRAKGNSDAAFKDFSEAIRLKPDDPDAFYGRGIVRSERGDKSGAVEDYDVAIRLKPDYANALFNRGGLRLDRGDLKGALKDYTRAIRIRPEDFDALIVRGNTRRQTGDVDGALKDYTKAIRIKPEEPYAFYNRALAYNQKGDVESALKDFDEAIRLHPDDADAFHDRSLARKASGDLKGAKKDQAEAIRLGYKPKP